MLIGLARGFPLPNGKRSQPWLEGMEDARLGRTRLGESARQSSERSTPLLVRLGPKHKWEGSPVEVLKAFHGTMATWIRHLTESRGTTFRPVQSVPVWFIGPLPVGWRRLAREYVASSIDCAEWLATHVSAIACDEAAGELFNDVKSVVEAIERAVNRPVPPRDLGPCPTMVNADRCPVKEPHHHPHACAFRLSAPRKATEVHCPSCKTTHRVRDLIDLLCNELEYWPLSSVEILGSRTSDLPGALDYYGATLARSTFHYWRKHGMLTVRGYRNKLTLAVMPERENSNDEPVFYLADVLGLLGHERGEKAG
jgi:hypothetical protein